MKTLGEERLADTWLLDVQPPGCEEISFCCLSPTPTPPSVCGILLWQRQPELTDTHSCHSEIPAVRICAGL